MPFENDVKKGLTCFIEKSKSLKTYRKFTVLILKHTLYNLVP